MVLDLDGLDARWQLPLALRWLDHLHACWDDQRADAPLPAAEELFLADLAEQLPSLLLAYRDVAGRLSVEFAGETARAVLGVDPLGSCPEGVPPGSPLAWIGDGYARAGRPAAPGAVQIRHGDRVALHLPYGDRAGRVSLIVTALGRWPRPHLVVAGRGPAAGRR